MDAMVFSSLAGVTWVPLREVSVPTEALAMECTNSPTLLGPATSRSTSAPLRTPSSVPASPISRTHRRPWPVTWDVSSSAWSW